MKRKGLSCSIILYKSTTLIDGSHPIVLRVTKNRIRKFISLGISSKPEKWSKEFSLLKKDKRINPDYEVQNNFITTQLLRAKDIINDFDKQKKDWTLNQFEEAFFNYSKKGKVKPFFEKLINDLRVTGHSGNANCYERTMNILEIFDKKFSNRIFSEIDIKYVRAFDTFLQTPRKTTYTSKKGNKRTVERNGCSGNTRKFYFKALRAVLNKAIEAKEASSSTYPFGKGGFEISKLGEETDKRYLPSEDLQKIKTKTSEKSNIEFSRLIFLFSYFCYGMSHIDMALLKKENTKRFENGTYIVYKRNKTSSAKNSKTIKIKLSDELADIIQKLTQIKNPIEDYLLPIISTQDLEGDKLYNHIKNRLKTINKNLKALSQELGIDNINLTSYVSRHTMAMTLQNNNVPREVISQILDHKDMKTTNTYLDSFSSNVIDEAVKVL
jgi:integrase